MCISTYKINRKEERTMADEVLKLQMLSVEEETDEVDGMRFSTTSLSWCGNWSAISAFGC